MSINRLPPVGRIRTVPKSLTIEYSDRSNASKWYQLEVPFVDAMHLLALLQGAKNAAISSLPSSQRHRVLSLSVTEALLHLLRKNDAEKPQGFTRSIAMVKP
jgi:hypothetical protein